MKRLWRRPILTASSSSMTPGRAASGTMTGGLGQAGPDRHNADSLRRAWRQVHDRLKAAE